MEKALSTLMQKFDITREQAIQKFNEICNEFLELSDHEETIRKATNIVEIMFK